MGGRSNGNIKITNEGLARFYGAISLENNGGFSSVRLSFPTIKVTPESKIKIRLKGDGSVFKFRVKSLRSDYYSYSQNFKTNNNWENKTFILKELVPVFRGKQLNLPNFDKSSIAQLTFLIGNKIPQDFELYIAEIEIIP